MLESLYLRVRRGESVQIFSHWVYYQDRMVVGSGLKIGEDGISYDHHFLLPRSGSEFRFLPGSYDVDVYAVVTTSSTPMCLGTVHLSLSEEQAKDLQENKDATAFFEWGPESQTYHVKVEHRPRSKEMERLMAELGDMLGIREELDAEDENK